MFQKDVILEMATLKWGGTFPCNTETPVSLRPLLSSHVSLEKHGDLVAG